MGTSISQPSPPRSNWKRVFVCYENDSIPESRVVNEVWRASETSDKGSLPISSDMKSDAVYSCYDAVRTSKTIQEAMAKFNGTLIKTKSNTIVSEFAKRAIAGSFQSKSPSEQWANNFFREVTNYIVSRDTSGFVGKNYRNKSVKDLIQFKQNLSNQVSQVVGSKGRNLKSKNDWDSFVDSCIASLKTSKP